MAEKEQYNKYVQELIEGCLKKDNQCFEKLYNLFADKMYAVVLRYTKDREEAKDQLQNGFIKAFQKLSYYKNSGSFEAWLKRVIINNTIEYIRSANHKRKNNEVEITDFNEKLSIGSKALENLSLEELYNYIAKLPDGYKMVFNLYVIDGFKHHEIAKKLNISINTSKTQLRKARLQLQQLIIKDRI